MKDDLNLTSREVLLCLLLPNASCGFPIGASAQEASTERAEHESAVSFEAIEPDFSVDSGEASMAKIQKLSKSGIAATQVIEIGENFDWVQLVSGE